ncbi:hypothetical protein VTO73DRAFT_14939 [Trametes versicolor]
MADWLLTTSEDPPDHLEVFPRAKDLAANGRVCVAEGRHTSSGRPTRVWQHRHRDGDQHLAAAVIESICARDPAPGEKPSEGRADTKSEQQTSLYPEAQQ